VCVRCSGRWLYECVFAVGKEEKPRSVIMVHAGSCIHRPVYPYTDTHTHAHPNTLGPSYPPPKHIPSLSDKPPTTYPKPF